LTDYQPTNLPTYQPTELPSYQATQLPSYPATQLPTRQEPAPLTPLRRSWHSLSPGSVIFPD
ncbi:hypothetical protein T484DRAFT_1645049, partial [Baffinella frigidus]